MATLIGKGSHARDILADRARHFNYHYAHHSEAGPFDLPVYIGINDPHLRAEVAKALQVKDEAWVHSNAFIGTNCKIHYGTHINYGVTVTRTYFGHHCTIGPGVTIAGDVVIDNRTLIGAGATICDRVTIGSDVTIGAGAVVLPETIIPDGETWVGVPAKRIR